MKPITETDKDFICEIQAPCFNLLTPEEINLIRQSKTQVLFRKGENLTKQGTFSTYVLFVMQGLVKQYVEDDGLRNYNLRLLKAGSFLGLSALFGEQVFSYSCVALSEVRVFLIEKEAFLKVIEDNGRFGTEIIKNYCRGNNGLYESIRQLMFKQMNGRMAAALLYLNTEEADGSSIFPQLTRRDIADFAGLSTETGIKLLKAFEKEGLIRLEDKNIIILKPQALLTISKNG